MKNLLRSYNLIVGFLSVGIACVSTYTAAAFNLSDSHQSRSRNYISIVVKDSNGRSGDTAMIAIEDMLHFSAVTYNLGVYNAVGHNGIYRFHIPVQSGNGYFDVFKTRTFTDNGESLNLRNVIEPCFWEAGDSIVIHLTDKETGTGIYSKYSFSGRGSRKYQLAHMADSLIDAATVSVKPLFDTLYNYFDVRAVRCKKALELLEQNKTKISEGAYQVLKADIIFGDARGNFSAIEDYYKSYIESGAPNVKAAFRKAFNKRFGPVETAGISENVLSCSAGYLRYNFYKYSVLSLVNNGRREQGLVFNLIKQRFKGPLRDKLLTFLLINYFPSSSSIAQMYAEAHSIIRDAVCTSVLNALIATEPGTKFTGFRLPDTSGKMVNFSDFKDKTVFIDFWTYGCGGCAKLYQEAVKKAEDSYKNDPDVIFISINNDKKKSRWTEGLKLGIYTSSTAINLGSDNGSLQLLKQKYGMNAYPFVLLIDKDGVVRYCNADNLYSYRGLTTAIKSLK